jgi:hypothetical protein
MAQSNDGFAGGFSRGISPFVEAFTGLMVRKKLQESQHELDIQQLQAKDKLERDRFSQNLQVFMGGIPMSVDQNGGLTPGMASPQSTQPSFEVSQPATTAQQQQGEGEVIGGSPVSQPIATPGKSRTVTTPSRRMTVKPTLTAEGKLSLSGDPESDKDFAGRTLIHLVDNENVPLPIAMKIAGNYGLIPPEVIKQKGEEQFAQWFGLAFQSRQQKNPGLPVGDAMANAASDLVGMGLSPQHMPAAILTALMQQNVLSKLEPAIVTELYSRFGTLTPTPDQVRISRDMETVRKLNNEATQKYLNTQAENAANLGPASTAIPQVRQAPQGTPQTFDRGVSTGGVPQGATPAGTPGGATGVQGTPTGTSTLPGSTPIPVRGGNAAQALNYSRQAGSKQAEIDVPERLPNAQVESLRQTGSLVASSTRILKTMNPQLIGPVSGRIRSYAQAFGASHNVDEVQAFAEVQDYLNNLIRVSAGLSQTAQEMLNQAKVAFSPQQTPEQFVGRLLPALERLQTDVNTSYSVWKGNSQLPPGLEPTMQQLMKEIDKNVASVRLAKEHIKLTQSGARPVGTLKTPAGETKVKDAK